MPPKKKKPAAKKPAARKPRKQLATKKKPPPQKRRPPPTPSSSSEDDDEPRGTHVKFRDSSSDSDDDDWRNASAAECRKRWGACPYYDIGFDIVKEFQFRELKDPLSGPQVVEEHQFSRGTLNLAPSAWKCPSTVVYTPPKDLAWWRTVSRGVSVGTSWAYFVKMDDDEYRYEYNPAEAIGWAEGGFTVSVESVIRALAKQEAKHDEYNNTIFSYTGYCDAGEASFDVKIFEGSHADIKRANIEDSEYASTKGLEDSMIFEVRLREATVPIGKWTDELEGMVRHLKSVEGQASDSEEVSPGEELESLRAKVKTLEEANEKLTRRLGRYEGKVLDLTAEDSDDEAPPPRSKLRELHDKETTKRVEKVKKERDDHESRGELLDSMVTPLESQRRELQEMVSAAAEALMERDVPTRMLADDATPFYYAQNSWDAEQEVPWNAEANRPLSLAEGIAWVHDNAKPPRKRQR